MKSLMTAALLLVGQMALAQTAEIHDIPGDQSTTIQITKGTAAPTDRDYDIMNSTAEIQGEPNVLTKGARDSWKKACNDWKSEVKDLNKENSILALNCNSPKCASEANGTTCTSTGTYQLKVKIRK